MENTIHRVNIDKLTLEAASSSDHEKFDVLLDTLIGSQLKQPEPNEDGCQVCSNRFIFKYPINGVDFDFEYEVITVANMQSGAITVKRGEYSVKAPSVTPQHIHDQALKFCDTIRIRISVSYPYGSG